MSDTRMEPFEENSAPDMFNRIKFCCKKDIWNDRGAIYNLTHMDGATKISELLKSFVQNPLLSQFFVDQAQEEGVGDKTNKHLTLSLLIDWLIDCLVQCSRLYWNHVVFFFISHKWWSHQQMVNLQLIQAKCCAAPQWEPIHRRQKKWKAFGHCSVACLHGMEGGNIWKYEYVSSLYCSVDCLQACMARRGNTNKRTSGLPSCLSP